MSGRFRDAQLEGEPEETEDEKEQCGSFQGRWRGWVEARVGGLQNGGTRSLSGWVRLRNLLFLVFDVGLYRWLCGEWEVVVVWHRRRLRQ